MSEYAQELGGRPFFARSLFRQAMVHFEDARVSIDHPLLMAGEARALAGLGDYARASELSERARSLDATTGLYSLLWAEYLERQGRFEEALAVSRVDPPSGVSIMPLGFDVEVSSTWDPVIMSATDARPSYIHDMTRGYTAGGTVLDSALLPAYRQDLVVSQPRHLRHLLTQCPIVSRVRRLVVAGHAPEALDLLTRAQSDGTLGAEQRTHWQTCTSRETRMIAAIAALEAGDVPGHQWFAGDELDLGAVHDARQNLMRYAGRLERADRAIADWRKQLPDDAVALDRAGEVAFLKGEPARAADLFGQAVVAYANSTRADIPNGEYTTDASSARRLAEFRWGVALAEQGEYTQAKDHLSKAATSDDCDLCGLIATQANLQLGTIALSQGDHTRAVEYLTSSVNVPYEDPARAFAAPYNNLSLALSLAGDTRTAIFAAEQAIERDPSNPFFWETLAFAYDKSGELDSAAREYQRALDIDPSLYSAASNLGILLARAGRIDDARAVLVRALHANPTYAKAWANLAMVQAMVGTPAAFLQAQGAQALAVTHDHELRGELITWQREEGIFETGIDVSRPVSPDWSFAAAARPTVPSFTIAMVLLVLLRIVGALGLDRLLGHAAEHALGESLRSRLPRLSRAVDWILPGWVGVVTIALLQAASASILPGSFWEFATLSVLVAAVAGGVIVARQLVGLRGEQHRTWVPLLGFTLALAPLQLAFAPVPVLSENQRPLTRWSGPCFLASVLALFSVASLITNTPIVRSVAEISCIMLASVLLPMKPMDGAFLKGRVANLGITVALGSLALAFTMRWV